MAANDNDGNPMKLTRAQLSEIGRARTMFQEGLDVLERLEKDIVTSDVQEYLVQTANPSAEMVAQIAQRLRAKGVLK